MSMNYATKACEQVSRPAEDRNILRRQKYTELLNSGLFNWFFNHRTISFNNQSFNSLHMVKHLTIRNCFKSNVINPKINLEAMEKEQNKS